MADISRLTGTANWTNYEDTTSKTTSNDTLGKDAFLQLLVAQLTNQDPTNPMQDTEFVAQLATYSGLEQQMLMNDNLTTLINSSNANAATSAVGLIGTVVGWTDDDGALQMGQVAFVDIVAGEVFLYMTDDQYIPFNKVEQIAKPIYVNDDTGTETETETEDDDSTGGASSA